MLLKSFLHLCSTRGRRCFAAQERLFVGASIALFFSFPIFGLELFPLSTCSMFASPYRQLFYYSLYDANGRRLNNDAFGIRTNVNWYLEYTYAVKYPDNHVSPPDMPVRIVDLSSKLCKEAKLQRVQYPLKLEVNCFGDVDGNKVGIISQAEWLIEQDGTVIRID